MHGTLVIHTRKPGLNREGFVLPGTLVPRHGWARTVVVLTGWTLLGSGLAQHPYEGDSPGPSASRTVPPVQFVGPAPATPPALALEPRAVAPTAAPAKLARFVPLVRVALPAITTDGPARAMPAAALTVQAPALPVPTPIAEPPVPLAPETPRPSAMAALRPVDVEQVAIDERASAQIAQLDEPAGAGQTNLWAEKAQVAQISLPQRELASMQADAPSQIVVRLADRAIGTVAVRVSEINTIDVQLSGLLDMMADSFAPEDFARLRGSAAADSYVSLDQLRAAGLGLRYDAVYDELVVGA